MELPIYREREGGREGGEERREREIIIINNIHTDPKNHHSKG